MKLKGSLSPAQGGEYVRVLYRARGRSVWRSKLVTVASSGAFTATVPGVRSSTDFVAQWIGAGAVAGAGTPAVTLTVTKKHR